MDDSVIQVQNFTKTYGDFVAVDDIGFNVKQGEIFGLPLRMDRPLRSDPSHRARGGQRPHRLLVARAAGNGLIEDGGIRR